MIHLPALERYLQHGLQPGHFLRAVLANDLMEAVGRADAETLGELGALVSHIRWHVPADAWGSHEAVDAWIQRVAA